MPPGIRSSWTNSGCRLLVQRSPANGVLVLDDTGLPKQGKASVGVQHQYSGTLGKQGNCQIVVSAEYVVDDPAPLSRCTGPSARACICPRAGRRIAARCRQAHVPEAVSFASKPDLALQLLDRAGAWDVPFATVVTDAGYGIPSFLRALDERQIPYVCAVASDFGVRLPAEMEQATADSVQARPRRTRTNASVVPVVPPESTFPTDNEIKAFFRTDEVPENYLLAKWALEDAERDAEALEQTPPATTGTCARRKPRSRKHEQAIQALRCQE